MDFKPFKGVALFNNTKHAVHISHNVLIKSKSIEIDLKNWKWYSPNEYTGIGLDPPG